MPISRHRIEFYASEIFFTSSQARAGQLLQAARREGGEALVQAVTRRLTEAADGRTAPEVRSRASRNWRKSAFADAAAVARREAGGGGMVAPGS